MSSVVLAKVNNQGEGLNPYSNGRYSMRIMKMYESEKVFVVLILILMEDTL